MADASARENRKGELTVNEAVDKVLEDPDRYRYRPAAPSMEELEADTFGAYKNIHSEINERVYRLRPEIAVSFSPDKKAFLLEGLISLRDSLQPYELALANRAEATPPPQLPSSGNRTKFKSGDRAKANDNGPGDYEGLEGTVMEAGPGESEYGVMFDSKAEIAYLNSWWLDSV